METSSTLRCRNVWNFAQGSKFKADLYSKMSVCRHELGLGVQPPNSPGNSNSGRYLAHTPISIAPCALALAPRCPRSFKFLVPPMAKLLTNVVSSIHKQCSKSSQNRASYPVYICVSVIVAEILHIKHKMAASRLPVQTHYRNATDDRRICQHLPHIGRSFI